MRAEHRERSESRAGVGVSSVMMILVVLAMAALGMLAYSRAKSTESMTLRNAEVAQAYYAAAADVQRTLREIDLAAYERPAGDALQWYKARGVQNVEWSEENGEIRFIVSVEDGQGRRIVAQGRMLEGGKRRYELSSHCLVSMQSDEPEYLDLIGD